MPFSINSNNNFFSRNIDNAQSRQNVAFQRLSSFNRINSAKDDPAGFAIANRLTARIQGADQAARNANDGISFTQTAQGGLSQVTDNLQRIRTLAVQASNSTIGSSGRNIIQTEINQLTEENTRITDTSSFNGQAIFPTGNATVSFQVGADGESGNQISVNLESLDSSNAIDVSSASSAQAAIEEIDAQLEAVSNQASNFGAIENRFIAAIEANESSSINAQEARSRISDTDVAKEISELINAQILEEVGIAVTAQANQSRKSVLSLLGG